MQLNRISIDEKLIRRRKRGNYALCLSCFCYWQFLWGLGVSPDEAECYDVYGLDEELLEMVPKPVLAVLFLYPITSQVLFSTKSLCGLTADAVSHNLVLLFFPCT
jgi:hypothetical protein